MTDSTTGNSTRLRARMLATAIVTRQRPDI